MALSDYAGNALLNSLFGKTSNFGALASAPTLYLALCTAVPTAGQAGSAITESAYTGYVRKSTAASDWAAAGGRQLANGTAQSFAACTGSTSTVNSFAILDASTNGNLVAFGYLTTSPQTISTGNITRSSNTATVSLTGHGFSSGNMVLISGCSQCEYNGWFVVTVTDANTFTFLVANTPVTPATADTGLSMTAATTTTLIINPAITPQFAIGTLVSSLG